MRSHPRSTPSARIERRTPYLLVLAGLLLASVASAGSAGTWSPVDADPYSPGEGLFRATAYDALRHQMLLFQDGTVYALSLDSPAAWTPLAVTGTAPTATLGQSMVYDAAHDRMLLFGGQMPNGILTNDLYALSLGPGAAWSLIGPAGTKPQARGFHTAIYDAANLRMIVFGGEASPTLFNDVWAFPVDGPPAWQSLTVAGTPPSTRTRAQAVYDGAQQRMLLFGGYDNALKGDVWSLSLGASPTWQAIPTSGGPSARDNHAMVLDPVANRLVVYGGFDGGFPLADVWALSLGSATWQPLSSGSTVVPGRYGASLIYDPIGSRLVTFGGILDFTHCPGANGRATWAFALNPDGDWSPLVMSLAPLEAAAVAFDPVHRDLVLNGGYGNGNLRGTWRLPVEAPAPQWTEASPSGTLPMQRSGAAGVWDAPRARMLMFGGAGYGVADNELWSYAPDPPAWSQIATLGTLAGSGRVHAGIVYDAPNDRLVVFGGNITDASTYALPLSGPGALMWTALTTTGTSPPARYGHSMVFDPVRDQAIVFGGINDPNPAQPPTTFNDVYSLSLAVDPPVWTALPTGPAKRRFHIAAYDGSEDRMVIYGGYDPRIGAWYNDLWELSLSSNTWSLLAPAGGPPAMRDNAMAVVDPFSHRMTIHGGRNPSELLLNDTWSLQWDAVAGVSPQPATKQAVAIDFAAYDRDARQLEVGVSLPAGSAARLDILDLAGRRVAAHTLEASGAASRRVQVDAAAWQSGMYFLHLSHAGRRATAKVVVVR